MVCVTVHAVWMIRIRLDGAVIEIVVACVIVSMAMPMLFGMVMMTVAVRMRMAFMLVLMSAVSMIMRVTMRMIVSVMRMTKRQNTNDVNEKAQNAHGHKLIEPLHIAPNRQSFKRLIYNLDADKPALSRQLRSMIGGTNA